ncbi:MAG: TlyA family rRNA (cytidine-2'-O)-methyltransferase [Phycisphaerae bacterium]|nr:TlyA family rRNA (cytidine-2'-O)-methyltransferase [Phycisphaerae bacterium]
MNDSRTCPYVGRGGLKLRHALHLFKVDVNASTCADFGCNVGGFTDCLLQAGAARVFAVDTGYGALAWTLRIDPRVTVMERTNALHAEPPSEPVDLVVIDMAWTPQKLCIPSALKWLRPEGRIITLIKPHYEATHGPEKDRVRDGVLDEADAHTVLDRVVAELPSHGVRVSGVTRSPVFGGAGKKNARGNIEFLALLERGA